MNNRNIEQFLKTIIFVVTATVNVVTSWITTAEPTRKIFINYKVPIPLDS